MKEEFHAQATKLIDLVDFQQDSVVSRQIISKKTGTITLFAFDEGQGLSEHTAPFDAFVYCLEGKVEVAISGTPLLLKEGEMLLCPLISPMLLGP